MGAVATRRPRRSAAGKSDPRTRRSEPRSTPARSRSCRRPSRRRRAEAKCPLLALVGDARVLDVATDDADPIRLEPRLDPERTARPPLAGEAVTHRDPQRIALRPQAKLPAATRGLARRHRAILRPRAPLGCLLGEGRAESEGERRRSGLRLPGSSGKGTPWPQHRRDAPQGSKGRSFPGPTRRASSTSATRARSSATACTGSAAARRPRTPSRARS
jgi:hypothetical protein